MAKKAFAEVFGYQPNGDRCGFCGAANKETMTVSVSSGPLQMSEATLCLKCFTNTCRLATGVGHQTEDDNFVDIAQTA